jgi:hypothetical protein
MTDGKSLHARGANATSGAATHAVRARSRALLYLQVGELSGATSIPAMLCLKPLNLSPTLLPVHYAFLGRYPVEVSIVLPMASSRPGAIRGRVGACELHGRGNGRPKTGVYAGFDARPGEDDAMILLFVAILPAWARPPSRYALPQALPTYEQLTKERTTRRSARPRSRSRVGGRSGCSVTSDGAWRDRLAARCSTRPRTPCPCRSRGSTARPR